MSEVLDPTYVYLMIFAGLIIAGLGIGYTAASFLGITGSIVLAAVLGFIAGLYSSREENELIGSLLLTGGFTVLVVWLLPLSLKWGVAVFLVGFIAGMRTDRR